MLLAAVLGCNLQWPEKKFCNRELSSIASATRCNFLCNVSCNGFARKVAGRLQRVTCPLCNLSSNIFRLATTAQSRTLFYFLQRLHRIFLNRLQVAACDCTVYHVFCNLFSNVERQLISCNTSLLCEIIASPKVAKRECYTLQSTCKCLKNSCVV